MSCALVSVKLVSVELVSICLMRSYLTDSNLPGIYWDYVVEHAALVNSMITPSIMDKVSVLRTPSEKLRTRSVRSFLDPCWRKKRKKT